MRAVWISGRSREIQLRGRQVETGPQAENSPEAEFHLKPSDSPEVEFHLEPSDSPNLNSRRRPRLISTASPQLAEVASAESGLDREVKYLVWGHRRQRRAAPPAGIAVEFRLGGVSVGVLGVING